MRSRVGGVRPTESKAVERSRAVNGAAVAAFFSRLNSRNVFSHVKYPVLNRTRSESATADSQDQCYLMLPPECLNSAVKLYDSTSGGCSAVR